MCCNTFSGGGRGFRDFRPSSGAFIHFYNVQRDVVDLQRVVVRGLFDGNPDFLMESGLFSLLFFSLFSSKLVPSQFSDFSPLFIYFYQLTQRRYTQ